MSKTRRINKEEQELKKTMLPEISLVERITYAILKVSSEDRDVDVEDFDNILDAAVAMCKMTVRKAKGYSARKRSAKKPTVNEPDEDKVKKAAELVDKAFGAALATETFLAESEGREINVEYLKKTAKRLVKAGFGKIEGLDVNEIDLAFDKESNQINITIPKNDEA